MAGSGGLIKPARQLVLLLLLAALCAAARADVQYEYDALGRLVRVTDELGRTAVYVYGPTGNITQILREDSPAGAPTVSSIVPNIVRQGQARTVQVNGTNLLSAKVNPPDASLSILVDQASSSQLVLRIIPRADATLGQKSLSVTNGVGSASATVEVRAPIVLSTVPAPVVVPPDALAHAVVIRMSDAEPAPTTFRITGGLASIATFSTTPVTVPAGQSEFQIAATGRQNGRTTFTVGSLALSVTQTFSIFVSPNSGPSSSLLGVFLTAPRTAVPLPALNVGVYLTPLAPGVVAVPAANTGVAFGATPQSVSPTNIQAGSTINLAVNGYSLGSINGMSFSPATGLTVGSPFQPNADQSQVSVPISAACSAPLQAREVSVSTASGTVEFANAAAKFVTVTGNAPVPSSLNPTTASAGAAFTLTLQGTNLGCASTVSATPSAGITFTSSPSVSADGTQLTVAVSIDAAANSGARVIQVTTPFGTSTSTGSAANTLTISL